MIAAENADTSLAGAILMVLLNGCYSESPKITSQDVLSKQIQDRCYFRKKMADKLAEIFITLGSDENVEEWKKNDLAGWRGFLKEEMKCHWKGFALWTVSNGSISCHYNADIILKPTGDIQSDEELLEAYISMNFDGLKEAITCMLGGEHVEVKIRTFQNDITSFENKNDVLTLLIHLGYLAYDSNRREAYIPNMEVAEAFEDAVSGDKWGVVGEAISNSERLLQATLSGDEKSVADSLEMIHEAVLKASSHVLRN